MTARPAPLQAHRPLALRFAGLDRDVLLPRSAGVETALMGCLNGWRADRPLRPGPGQPLARVEVQRSGRFLIHSANLDESHGDLPLASTVCALIAHLAEAFCDARPGRSGLHCGAVRLAGGPLMLLAGRARAGKSTLVARLSLEPDAEIFADDVLAVESCGTAIALGTAMRLRLPLPTTLADRLSPQIGLADRGYGYLESPALVAHGTRARPGAIVALHRRPGPARLHHLPPDRALLLLLGQSITEHPDAAHAFARARDLAADLPALTLAYEDLEEAVALLRRAFGTDAPQIEPPLPDATPMAATAPPPDQRLRRSPDTAVRRQGEGLFLWKFGGARLWHLSALAHAIWILLARPQTAGDLADALIPLFPQAEPARIIADIGAFLGAALADGLLEPETP